MKSKVVLLMMMCSLMCACGKEPVEEAPVYVPQQVEFEESATNSEESKVLTGIEINDEDFKKEYLRSEPFEDSKVSVSAVYSDGTTEPLRRGELTISEVDTTTCGTKEVVVSYQDYSKVATVTVNYNIIDMEDATKYTTSKLNLRSGPGLEFEQVKAVPAGTPVIANGVADNNWYRVLYQQQVYYCSNKFLTDEKPFVATSKYVGNTIIVQENGADQKAVEEAVRLWNTLPDKVKNLLRNNKWEIYISNSDLTLKFNYNSKITGVTMAYLTAKNEFQYGSGSIYLNDNVDDIKKSFYYEVGHAIDYTYGLISKTTEFGKCFKAESNLLDIENAPNMKYKTEEAEFCALVYSEMLAGNKSIAGVVPGTYAFLSSYIN